MKFAKVLLFVFPVLLFAFMVAYLAPRQEHPMPEQTAVESPKPQQSNNSQQQSNQQPQKQTQQEQVIDSELSGSNIFEYPFAGTSYLYVVFEVKNTGNVSIELDTGDFCLYDAAGNLLDVVGLSQPYPHIIKPGEVAYYAESIANNYAEPISSVELQRKASKTTEKCRYLDVSNATLVSKDSGILKGALTIKNNSGRLASSIRSCFVLRDQCGKLVAILTGWDYEKLQNGSSFSTTVDELTLSVEDLQEAGFTDLTIEAFAFTK